MNTTKATFAGLSPIDTALLLAHVIANETPALSQKIENAERQIKDYPLQSLIGKELQDASGRTIAKSPGTIEDTGDEYERSVRDTMHENARLRHEIVATARIVPVIQQLNLQHRLKYDDFMELIISNPFIPPDRQLLFMRGLFHGFCGDFMVAFHLLIPQVENSIRFVLEQSNAITSSFNNEGIQEPLGLGHLFYKVPEVKQIFGEDLVFELQGLLIERFGSNLRNRLSHGLLNDGEATSARIVYAWGLILQLVCIPILAVRARESSVNTDSAH